MTNPNDQMHPVQRKELPRHVPARITSAVTLKAYEVYKHCFGEQRAMIEGHCRGGFSTGELIAFLYARSFPQSEWRSRVDQALNGMENL